MYNNGTGTRGQGQGGRDISVGTWDLGTRDEGLGDIKTSMGPEDVWDGDTGSQIPGWGNVNDYCKSRRYTVNAISVTFLVNMFWQEPKWDREGILGHWPGYVNFTQVIFRDCN